MKNKELYTISFKKFFSFLVLLSIINMDTEANNSPKLIILPHMAGIHFSVQVYRTASSFGAVGDGVTDDTYALRKAFSSGLNLDLEGKKYLINVSKPAFRYGLIPSNNTIIKGSGAEIILKPNNFEFYSMITLMNSKNVKIYNLKLTGDIKSHKGSKGEWGIGIMMLGTKNCELHHVKANETWGDGFYVGAYGEETNVNGGIFNSSARANLRVGLSVARCKNFTVKNCNFTDTGTIKYSSPGYGVDIEPNPHDYDSIDGIKLINIKTENNLGGGILFVPLNLEYSTNPNAVYNVYIEKFISNNDGKLWGGSSLYFVEPFNKNTYDGHVEIKGFEVINLEAGGVAFGWKRNNNSSLTVDAVNLKVNGVTQYDYHY